MINPPELPINDDDRNDALLQAQAVVGLRLGGARGKTTKGGPLMTSSYSPNRDKHF